jgi:hypothetical protein
MQHELSEQAINEFPVGGDDELSGQLDGDMCARIKAELEPGERLLWAGSSNPPPERFGWGYFLFGAVAAFLFLLGTATLADAFGRFGRRPPEQSSMVGGLFFYGVAGIIVIAIFGSMTNDRIKRRAAANVLYTITDRRVISWVPDSQAGGVRVRSLPKGHILDVVRVERSDGSGKIEFACSEPAARYNFHTNELQDIPNVRRVEQIIRRNLIAGEISRNECERNFDRLT